MAETVSTGVAARCFAGTGLLVASLMLSARADARDDSNTVVALGVYSILFNDHSGELRGPFTPPGVRAAAKRTTTAALVVSRDLSPDVFVSVAIGVPPTYRLSGRSTARALRELGSAEAVSPAVLMQYRLLTSGPLRPFVGAGATITNFAHAKASSSLEAALGGETMVRVGDRLSPTTTAGLDIVADERWLLTVSAAYTMLRTQARLATGGVERRLAMRLDPIVLRATIGLRF